MIVDVMTHRVNHPRKVFASVDDADFDQLRCAKLLCLILDASRCDARKKLCQSVRRRVHNATCCSDVDDLSTSCTMCVNIVRDVRGNPATVAHIEVCLT